MKEFCVYILECNDGSYYTGMTSDINKRIEQHHNGIYPTCYTYSRRPLKVLYVQKFTDFSHAMAFEKQIKGWSRKKKKALIEGRFDDLVKYSRNYTQYGSQKDEE